MTESDWQGDMLRRMSAEQSPAEEPSRTDPPPAVQPPVAEEPPAPPAQEPQPAQYPDQPPPPPYQQQPVPPPYYPPPPPQQPYYPPQQPYYPPPPYQQPPQYGQLPPVEPPPYQVPQYPTQYPEQYPQQPPPPQYHQQPPQYYQPAPNTGWGPPPPQPDQTGGATAPEGESVLRRFRRFASEAAYLVGASGRMQRDVENIATIRRPIAIMRRVGVLSPVTNGGTSTVSALLAMMLSAQRSDRVVAIDADQGGAELSRRLEFSPGAGPVERVSLVRSEGTADAVRRSLAEAQSQGARDVGLAVVDCPGSMYDEVSMEMASSAHCIVLVIPSVQHVANYCIQQLDQLTPDGQNVLLTRGVVVITMVQEAPLSSVDWLMEAFRQRGLEPLVLPYDQHIAQAWPVQAEQIQDETRRAVLDLSARVVQTVTGATG